LVNKYYGHTNVILGLVVLPDKRVATGAFDSTVRIWDLTGQNSTVLNMPGTTVVSLFINPVTGYLVVNMVGFISFYDPITLNLIRPTTNTSGRDYTRVETLLPSGNIIGGGAFLDIYNGINGSLLASFTPCFSVCRLKLMPDNRTVMLGLGNGSLQMFDPNSYTFSGLFAAHTGGPVTFLTFTPDLIYMVTGSYDFKIIMWNYVTMTKLVTYTAYNAIQQGFIIPNPFTGKCCFP
jgi:WD40 repeat protein